MKNFFLFLLTAFLLIGFSLGISSFKKGGIQQVGLIPISDGFDYPIGESSACCTPSNDGDGWYNANEFMRKNHMGEDWNREGSPDSDCGLPVKSVSNGLVIYSYNGGPTWGNIIIVRHQLPNGRQVESLYAHLKDGYLAKYGDRVSKGDLIAYIGDGEDPCGDGRPYGAHLHFEMRTNDYRYWGHVGPGYSNNARGMLDPSNFIDQNRNLSHYRK